MIKKNREYAPCKILFYASIITILVLTYSGNNTYAAPTINNISVQNQTIKLGETEIIVVNCTDNASNITAVYADINNTNNFFQNNSFNHTSSDIYAFSISTDTDSIFEAAGIFNVTGYCINDLNETANSSTSFIVLNQTFRKERQINVSINSFDDGYIGYFDYTKEITQYSRMNITVEFINSGSTSYTKKTELDIYGVVGETFTLISNRSGGTSALKPGGRVVEKLRYTPMISGYFWIRIKIYYSDKTANAWGTFHVKPYYDIGYYPGTTIPPSSGGGLSEERVTIIQLNPVPVEELVPKSTLDHGIKGLSISYPDKVFINPGESAVAYVIFNNSGTMPLRNLMILSQINGDILIDVQPKTIYELYGNHSAVFMITLDTSPNISEGIYSLDFTAYTDKMKEYGHIDVDVGKMNIDDSLERTINSYQYLIIKLEEDVDDLNFEGKDTNRIVPYINEAKNTLRLAKDAFRLKDYEKTRDNLKKTRNSLINAVIEAALARGDNLLIVMAPTIWLLIVLLIIMIIAAIALYLHKREHEKNKKEDELKETARGE